MTTKKTSKKKSAAKVPEIKKNGRPTSFKEEYIDMAYKLCLLGATDKEMADIFEVALSTFNLWKLKNKYFSDSLKKGKQFADANVSSRLYERAMGYSHSEDKIFNDSGIPLVVPTTKHYPPDTVAAIFWLKNRQPAKWRDKQDIEHSGEIDHGFTFIEQVDDGGSSE